MNSSFKLALLSLLGALTCAELGAMNRLRDVLHRQGAADTTDAHWMLALAFVDAGLDDVALELLN